MKWVLALYFLVSASVCIIFFAVIMGYGVNTRSPTIKGISDALSGGVGTVFKMKDITGYQWDRFYVFEPYTSREMIHDAIGSKFLKAYQVPLGVDEQYCLLVFVKDGRVVEHFTFHRSKGDFGLLAKTKPASPDEAIYKIIGDHSGTRLRIVKSDEREPRIPD